MASGKNIYYIYSYLREDYSPYYIGFYNVKSGHRKRHKDIIKVELVE